MKSWRHLFCTNSSLPTSNAKHRLWMSCLVYTLWVYLSLSVVAWMDEWTNGNGFEFVSVCRRTLSVRRNRHHHRHRVILRNDSSHQLWKRIYSTSPVPIELECMSSISHRKYVVSRSALNGFVPTCDVVSHWVSDRTANTHNYICNEHLHDFSFLHFVQFAAEMHICNVE